MEKNQESSLRVNWWGVLSVFIVVLGFFFLTILNHEGRLTKVETSTQYIIKSLDHLSQTADESNDMLRKHVMEQGK